MSKVKKTLSLSDVEKRIAQLNADEKKAQEAYEQAALAEATETGTEKETIEAKRSLDAIRAKRDTLRAAARATKKDHSERRTARIKQQYADWQKSLEEDLKARTNLVKAIVETSDKLGALLARHFGIQEKLRRTGYNFMKNSDLGGTDLLGAASSFNSIISRGHDIRVIVGATIEREHDVKLQNYIGDRHSLRGEDPIELDRRFAEKALGWAQNLNPEGAA